MTTPIEYQAQKLWLHRGEIYSTSFTRTIYQTRAFHRVIKSSARTHSRKRVNKTKMRMNSMWNLYGGENHIHLFGWWRTRRRSMKKSCSDDVVMWWWHNITLMIQQNEVLCFSSLFIDAHAVRNNAERWWCLSLWGGAHSMFWAETILKLSINQDLKAYWKSRMKRWKAFFFC